MPSINSSNVTQTDFNGDTEVFDLKSVEMKEEIITNVYPNPTADSKMNVVVSQSGTVVMNLYNLYGQLVKTQTVEAHNGNVVEQLELPEGGNTFFVELVQNNELIGRHKIITSR